jgi:hypothetical protein
MKQMNIKWQRAIVFAEDRLWESSTWQGIAFILAFFGSKFAADFDIMGATALGATVSAAIKVFFPDVFTTTDK